MHGVLVNVLEMSSMRLNRGISMNVIKIDKDNVNLIMRINQKLKKKDTEFLDALWQYVLFSKSVSRKLPFCIFCHEHGKFTFEGFGGIKKVGGGLMYIPVDNDQLYIIPDIIFHYFYMHRISPTKKFRSAVIHGLKPTSEQYTEKIKTFYKSKTILWSHIMCPRCGESIEGPSGFVEGRKGSVAVYRQSFWNSVLQKDRYCQNERIHICHNCLHCVKDSLTVMKV